MEKISENFLIIKKLSVQAGLLPVISINRNIAFNLLFGNIRERNYRSALDIWNKMELIYKFTEENMTKIKKLMGEDPYLQNILKSRVTNLTYKDWVPLILIFKCDLDLLSKNFGDDIKRFEYTFDEEFGGDTHKIKNLLAYHHGLKRNWFQHCLMTDLFDKNYSKAGSSDLVILLESTIGRMILSAMNNRKWKFETQTSYYWALYYWGKRCLIFRLDYYARELFIIGFKQALITENWSDYFKEELFQLASKPPTSLEKKNELVELYNEYKNKKKNKKILKK